MHVFLAFPSPKSILCRDEILGANTNTQYLRRHISPVRWKERGEGRSVGGGRGAGARAGRSMPPTVREGAGGQNHDLWSSGKRRFPPLLAPWEGTRGRAPPPPIYVGQSGVGCSWALFSGGWAHSRRWQCWEDATSTPNVAATLLPVLPCQLRPWLFQEFG